MYPYLHFYMYRNDLKQRNMYVFLFMYIYITYIYSDTMHCRDLQAKQHKQDWVQKHGIPGFPYSVALGKQRCHIIDKAVQGKVRSVEQAMLDTITFSGCVVDHSVVLNDALMFDVTFNTGSEKICKTVHSLGRAHEWLMSMTTSYKSGDLAKGFRVLSQSARPEVELSRAATSLQSTSTNNVAEAVASISEAVTSMDVADVTSEILATQKSLSVPLPLSTTAVHKGSFETFKTLGHGLVELSGVLLGKPAWNGKVHVTQIVITTESVESLLTDSHIESICTSRGLQLLGAIVKGQESDRYQKAQPMFDQIGGDSPMLVCVDYSDNPTGFYSCWELTSDGIITAKLSWTSQPHDQTKRLRYNICWLKDLGVSHVEAATQKICDAVVSHVVQHALPTNKKALVSKPAKFVRYNVPPDGYCGWHTLVAGMDFHKFKAVPRRSSGYARSTLMRDSEDQAAKDLHQRVCEAALMECPQGMHAAIRRVLKNPSFSPSDCEWISLTTGMSLRCSCCEEARIC